MTGRRSLRNNYFYKKFKEYHSPIHYASFDILLAKIGRLCATQSTFECPKEIGFFMNFEAKWPQNRCLVPKSIFKKL